MYASRVVDVALSMAGCVLSDALGRIVMGSKADADYFAARAAKHDEMAERTSSLEAQQAHRELSNSYASRAATLTDPMQRPVYT